ncbi:hypothetical protein SGPA1_80107 [Streptomyces misionensis JCM 4497]
MGGSPRVAAARRPGRRHRRHDRAAQRGPGHRGTPRRPVRLRRVDVGPERGPGRGRPDAHWRTGRQQGRLTARRCAPGLLVGLGALSYPQAHTPVTQA